MSEKPEDYKKGSLVCQVKPWVSCHSPKALYGCPMIEKIDNLMECPYAEFRDMEVLNDYV